MMLMFLFHIGADRYVISAEKVVKVLPRVHLKSALQAPSYVAGLLNLGGLPVPVVDLSQIIEGRPSASALHTRIILLRFHTATGEEYPLGLMTEKLLRTIEKEQSDFIDAGIRFQKTPYFDGILTDEFGVIQFIIIEELFKSIKEELFSTKMA